MSERHFGEEGAQLSYGSYLHLPELLDQQVLQSDPPRLAEHVVMTDAPASKYDDRMKRITVSLPDELVDRIKRAAGGEGQVSSYVATALADYQEQESLDELLAAWRAESPVPDEVRQQVEAELDDVGLTGPVRRSSRVAG
jgi:predicted transcriptional regulator